MIVVNQMADTLQSVPGVLRAMLAPFDQETLAMHAKATLLRDLSLVDLAKSASYDGRRFEAHDFVHEWPFHDQDHLQQIFGALKRTYLPHMSPTMRDALTA